MRAGSALQRGERVRQGGEDGPRTRQLHSYKVGARIYLALFSLAFWSLSTCREMEGGRGGREGEGKGCVRGG